MFGIDDRALRISWTVLLLLLILTILYLIRSVLVVFAAAIFFAYMLSPIVLLVERILPRRRTLALTLVYILLVGALVGIGFALIPVLFSQATSLLTRLPALLSGGSSRLSTLPLPQWLDPMRAQIIATLTKEPANLEASLVPLLQQAGAQLLSGVGVILPTILIPILAFFFLKDGQAMTNTLIGEVDNKRDRRTLNTIVADINQALKMYVRSLVILAAISFVVWATFLKVMGIQYELLLAGGAALLEFIPVIGPAVALAIILVVSAVTGSGGFIAIIVFWGVYRLFQDYVLNPYLMRAGLELHPLLVLFGVLAGDQLAGVPGMFFSVPVIAILKVIFENVRAAHVRKVPAGSLAT